MRATLFGFAVALATAVAGQGTAAPPVERPVARPVETKAAKVEPKVETKAAQAAPKIETKAAKVEAKEFARPKLEPVPNPKNERTEKHHMLPYKAGNGLPRGSQYLTDVPVSTHRQLHREMEGFFKRNPQFNESVNGKSVSSYPFAAQERASKGITVQVPLEKRLRAYETFYKQNSERITGVDLTPQYKREVEVAKSLGKLK